MNVATLLVWQWKSFRTIATMQSIKNGLAKVDGKVKQVVKSFDVEEAIELFNE